MELYEVLVYIVGAGLIGAMAGLILGVILGAEQIVRLRDQNERLKKALGKTQEDARPQDPQIINITIPEEIKNVPEYGKF